MLYLHVPFKEKDKAKSLGAVWVPSRKQWAVKNRNDYYKFSKWFLKEKNPSISESVIIILDHFYIVEGSRACWKCGKDTPIIGIGIDKYIHLYAYDFCDETEDGYIFNEEYEYETEIEEDDIHIAEGLLPWPKQVLAYLKDNYNYHSGFSKTLQCNCYANHCKHCNAMQGNHFIFEEPESPFWFNSIDDVRKLKIHKVNLPYDIVSLDEPGYSSTDDLIKQYASHFSIDSLILD